MNTIANQNNGTNTLTFAERVLRVAVGSAFIGSVFAATTTVLHWQVLLPLIGSYAVVSGITGTGILSSFLDNQPGLYRGVRFALSVGLIGTVFIADTAPLGLIAILPLVGIYTALATLLGQSPMTSVLEAAKIIPHIVTPHGALDEAHLDDAQRKHSGMLSHVA